MKIAIISDTHDNMATLEKFLEYAKNNGIEAVVHCGDIASGPTLERLAKDFKGNVLAVYGNMDYRQSVAQAAQIYPGKVSLFKDFGQTEIGGLKIGFCHFPEQAKSACGKNFDFVFYGHTHKPWLETVNGCQLANPGTLAGMFYKATFAILDTSSKKIDLVIVERI